jgi:hypothetical protein
MVEAERMYRDVDLYAKVRRAVMVEGISEREAAKQFGIDRKTVSKMIRHAVPPGYQRKDPPESPKLGPFVGIVMCSVAAFSCLLEADVGVDTH